MGSGAINTFANIFTHIVEALAGIISNSFVAIPLAILLVVYLVFVRGKSKK